MVNVTIYSIHGSYGYYCILGLGVIEWLEISNQTR